jgi:hypothetical protein
VSEVFLESALDVPGSPEEEAEDEEVDVDPFLESVA